MDKGAAFPKSEVFLLPKMTYASKLKDPRWQKLRLHVLERDEFTCQLCKDTETELHVHHYYYPKSYNPWDADIDSLVTYCKHCHAVVEFNKNGDTTPYDIFKVLLEGNKIKLLVFSYESDYIEIYRYNEIDNILSYITSLSPQTIAKIFEYQTKRNTFFEEIARKSKKNG